MSIQKSVASNIFSAFLAMVFLVSCATRPLPGNITRYDTFRIALKIRCELRDAIQDSAKALLKVYGHSKVLGDLESGVLSYGKFVDSGVDSLDEIPKRLANRYFQAVIAYEFEFDITEENNLSGGVGFLDILSRGQLTLGISGKKDRKRQNKRNFKAVDNFGDLISNRAMNRLCKEFDGDRRKNSFYPISGYLGLREVVDTFISLNQSGNLVGNTKETLSIPTLADTLTFTTTISGTVNPVVKLNAVGTGFQLSGASLKAVSTRVDTHKLVLALTLPAVKITREGFPVPVAVERNQLEKAAIIELERQRIKEIDSDTEQIRDRLRLGL